jgi:hypothetical protein
LSQILRIDSTTKSRENWVQLRFSEVIFRDDGSSSTVNTFGADNAVRGDSLSIHNHTGFLFSLPVIRDQAFMPNVYSQGLCTLIHQIAWKYISTYTSIYAFKVSQAESNRRQPYKTEEYGQIPVE